MQSTVNNKTYQLYISLPAGYNSADTTRYPVLYILDANYSYLLISSLHNLLDSGQEIEKIIIVAIGDKDQSNITWNTRRMIDYTPSNDPNVDTEIASGFNIPVSQVKTGGAKSFLTTIRTDIIPFIDMHYKTTNDRGISGHSVGGLFAGYCLLNAPIYLKDMV
ncbi:alpha/beta hydrolase [Flavobacterium sp.]|uniref:alpha/beta hydrolase n=1 Tax=Flavobacterium sp. TaxID=239 RepID=UPI003752DF8F